MVFSSAIFLFVFLPIVCALYFIVPGIKGKNTLLIIASLIFYAFGEPIYILLMIGSIIANYIFCLMEGRFSKANNIAGKKIVLIIAVICNIGVLCVFKYTAFILENINYAGRLNIKIPGIALPIGISFYTFQTMSYTIDVYRGEAKVQKNFITFGAYVALFPQLIAGPIVRYQTVAEQMDSRKETLDLFKQGVLRFVVGLGKKVLIANQVGALWNEIAQTKVNMLTTSQAWLGAVAFTLQIYFDFSGYSDMAIGLGKMFGFEFLENFDYPYESKSITEFWRRWHISLGTWFKEYVYFPLGGNRKGKKRQFLNIAIVWCLTGLWHGAAICFVVWGVYYGLLLIIEKSILKKFLDRLPAFIARIYTLVIVTVGWSIFSWPDMIDGGRYLKTMFGLDGAGIGNSHTAFMLLNYRFVLLMGIIGSTSLAKRLSNRILPDGTLRREILAALFVFLILGICMAYLINSSYNPFLYFRF